MPLPEPGPGEALVRITCCTLCGSDLHTVAGRREEPVPSILGHEIVGQVQQVGSEAPRDCQGQTLQAGDRITWSVVVSCSHCDRCLAGYPQKCRELFKYGHARCEGPYALSGGLAEYILLRAGTAIFKLPDELDDMAACPANCATATVVACFRSSGSVASKRVLILGAGMLGLTASAFAADQSAGEIVLVDPQPSRAEMGARFGANATLPWDARAGNLPDQLASMGLNDNFDVIFELSGAHSAIESSLHCAAVGARIVWAGAVLPTPSASVDPQAIVRQCISIQGVHNYRSDDLQAAISFLGRVHETYPFAELIGRTYALHDTNQAFQDTMQQKPIRAAVCPQLS